MPNGVDRLELASGLERVIAMLRRLNPASEISLTAASTLATLARLEGCRLTELAEREGVSQPSMTALVSRLEQRGLARRQSDRTDGRVAHVVITAAGRELLARRREQRAYRLAELLRTLPRADEDALAAALPAINRLVERACERDRPAGSDSRAHQ